MKADAPAEAASKAQAAYQVQLAHLDACPQCRREAPCEEGRRIRRALQAARAAAAAPMNSRRSNGGL
ncbi:hypothetical protein ACGFSB_36180 [Streptomyces sp. NPDC048441]|uniref:hypothetical protein n=1 Tax=Streptomyces sp. NPDC048441 TaxID=3365552 RepID=UPI00371A6FFA